MRKVIGAFNMTLDGNCDHRAGIADDELHQHYTALLNGADSILYGRITFALMEFWPTLLKNPTGEKAMDDFALAIDKIPKIVFSNTLKQLDWETASLATKNLEQTVKEVRQQPGREILVGSRSLIISLLNLGLLDELQLCIQPVIAGAGLRLFENINQRTVLELTSTKLLPGSGAVIHYYRPKAKE